MPLGKGSGHSEDSVKVQLGFSWRMCSSSRSFGLLPLSGLLLNFLTTSVSGSIEDFHLAASENVTSKKYWESFKKQTPLS